jgi:predicted transcriptional regulator
MFMKGNRGETNPTREELDRYICQNPGASFSLIKTAFRINSGTLRYHLDYLERENRIRSILEKGNKRYFPDFLARFTRNGLGDREMSGNQRRVRNLIAENPGITRKKILTSLDISREELTESISALREKRLITVEEEGGTTTYMVMTGKKLAAEVIAILVEKVLDSEMDMETFRMIKDRVDSRVSEIGEQHEDQ